MDSCARAFTIAGSVKSQQKIWQIICTTVTDNWKFPCLVFPGSRSEKGESKRESHGVSVVRFMYICVTFISVIY